jgi:hypothetical protein
MTKKKTLLKEGTVRQFMKLANLQPLTTGFVETLYEKKQTATDEEDEHLGAEDGKEADKKQSFKDRRKEERGEDRAKGEKPKGTEGTNESIATNPHHVVSEEAEDDLVEVDLGEEEELEVDAVEMGEPEPELPPEGEAGADAEVTISPEEAEVIIGLGAKLDAASEEGGEEVMDAEEEIVDEPLPGGGEEISAAGEEELMEKIVARIAENVTTRVRELSAKQKQPKRKLRNRK